MLGQSLTQTQLFQDVFAGAALSTNLFELEKSSNGMRIAGPNGFSGPASNFHNVNQWTLPTGPMTNAAKAGHIFSGAMGVLPAAAIGYSESGIRGAATGVAGDVAAHAALVRFHYAPAAARQIKNNTVAPGIFTGAGGGATLGTRALNTMSYLGKGMVGGFGGGMVGGSVGGYAGKKIGGERGQFVGQIGGTFGGAYLGTAAVSAMGSVGGASVATGLGAISLGAGALVGGAAMAGYGSYQTLKAGYRYRQMQKSIHTSGSLAAFHTQGAQTMRGRAVSAIHKSHLNARSALGQEASLLHMPSRNYNSKYRRFY